MHSEALLPPTSHVLPPVPTYPPIHHRMLVVSLIGFVASAAVAFRVSRVAKAMLDRQALACEYSPRLVGVPTASPPEHAA